MTSAKDFTPRSGCPIAATLDLVGDRWTLVIVRDMMNGKCRFSEFLASPEEITTNILTNRLAAMVACGLIEKTPYQRRPLRYEYRLTEMGMGLLPVLQEVCRWGNLHMPETWIPPESFMRQKI